METPGNGQIGRQQFIGAGSAKSSRDGRGEVAV
ncbi:hypothetical protein LP7551_00543 [Roseibium album]|nr:hypothetical protein LP7551_00543 [Roseibium album]